MNRIDALFARKNSNILSIYLTAGFPTIDSTVPVIQALANAGVDIVELGVPFSDPMADGPTIQDSSTQALRNGMTLHRLMEQAAEARAAVPDLPMVLMSYLNPLIQYGPEQLFADCAKAGIDAMIVPDLPFDEYLETVRPLCRRYNIPMIMLITPETSPERIHLIDDNCDGFIYMVSAAATTGTRTGFEDEQLDYFRRVNAMTLRHPRLIGFGISNAQTLADACANASGAIVGSLFVKCLAEESTPQAAVDRLMQTLGIR